jgi:hypothetical protein
VVLLVLFPTKQALVPPHLRLLAQADSFSKAPGQERLFGLLPGRSLFELPEQATRL